MDFYTLCAVRIAKTNHLVEADSFASHVLWERWALDAAPYGPAWDHRVPWIQLNPGRSIFVGTTDGMPVYVTLFWAEVDGGLVCFWTSESMVADHRLVSAYLERTFPGVPKTDAMNFGNVIRRMRWDREHRPTPTVAPLMRWASVVPGRPWALV